jgi:hypothetical protein
MFAKTRKNAKMMFPNAFIHIQKGNKMNQKYSTGKTTKKRKLSYIQQLYLKREIDWYPPPLLSLFAKRKV